MQMRLGTILEQVFEDYGAIKPVITFNTAAAQIKPGLYISHRFANTENIYPRSEERRVGKEC